MADVSSTLRAWSGTASSNSPSGSAVIGAGLDDNLREIQAVTKKFLAGKGTAIASAATMDLTTMDGYYASVSGNTTVTGLGTEVAGISYWLRTASTPMFKHGASAIVMPGSADLTAAAGDVFRFTSEGSGVWVLTQYLPSVSFTGTGSVVRATAPTLSGANMGSSSVATTAAVGDNSTKLATTAYVDQTRPTNITAQATTSGTAFDFTIPSWATQITVTLKAISLSGSDNLLIQLSDAGGPEASAVGVGGSVINAGATSAVALSTGFLIGAAGSGASVSGSVIITLHNATDFTWVAQGICGNPGDASLKLVGGYESLSAALSGIRLTRSGTDTFDAGEVAVRYS